MRLLEVENLHLSVIKQLPGGKILSRDIVKNASFYLEKGCILGILGESGSGKTIIALTLSGLLAKGIFIHSGTVYFNGKRIDLKENSNILNSLRGRGILLLPQSPSAALNPYRSVEGQIKEVNPRIDVKNLLEIFGVHPSYASKNPFTLSGGMKRRVLLAIALALKPSLLILDEPTEGLDPVTKWEMLSLIKFMMESLDTGIILITHDIESLAAIEKMVGKDRFCTTLLHRNTLTAKGNIRELNNYLEKNYAFVNSVELSCGLHDGKRLGNKPLFELESAKKEYRGGLKVLDNISLSLREGEWGGVIGRSGAGKTTLLKCIAGIESLTEGNFKWKGTSLNPFPYRLKGQIQMLWQDPYVSLNPYLTALEIISEPSKGKETSSRIKQIIDMLGIEEEFLARYPWELSGGQCQKVALARVLVSRPKLLLADEPFSGLFPFDKKRLIKALKVFCIEEGITLFIASHDLGLVKSMVDKVWVMEKGRIVEHGLTEKVFSRPSHPETVSLLDFGCRFFQILRENIS